MSIKNLTDIVDVWSFSAADIREEVEFDSRINNELLSAMYVFQEAVSRGFCRLRFFHN